MRAEDGPSLEESGLRFDLHAIIGGQLADDDEPALFLVYPEGNWVDRDGRLAVVHHRTHRRTANRSSTGCCTPTRRCRRPSRWPTWRSTPRGPASSTSSSRSTSSSLSRRRAARAALRGRRPGRARTTFWHHHLQDALAAFPIDWATPSCLSRTGRWPMTRIRVHCELRYNVHDADQLRVRRARRRERAPARRRRAVDHHARSRRRPRRRFEPSGHELVRISRRTRAAVASRTTRPSTCGLTSRSTCRRSEIAVRRAAERRARLPAPEPLLPVGPPRPVRRADVRRAPAGLRPGDRDLQLDLGAPRATCPAAPTRRPPRSTSSSAAPACAATTPTSGSASAERSASRRATCPGTPSTSNRPTSTASSRRTSTATGTCSTPPAWRPIDGLVRIATGRDAADVAFAAIVGAADARRQGHHGHRSRPDRAPRPVDDPGPRHRLTSRHRWSIWPTHGAGQLTNLRGRPWHLGVSTARSRRPAGYASTIPGSGSVANRPAASSAACAPPAADRDHGRAVGEVEHPGVVGAGRSARHRTGTALPRQADDLQRFAQPVVTSA